MMTDTWKVGDKIYSCAMPATITKVYPPQKRGAQYGDPLFWESSDGRRTFVPEVHPKNIIHGLHKLAVKENALDITGWCRDRYPQYDGLLRKASEEVYG